MNKTGFGFLRLPMMDEQTVAYSILDPLVDRFLALGGTYFDTAYTYLNGLSEEAICKSLTQRYPREKYILADKLPGYQLKSYDECELYFQRSLHRCGVDYFDVYLLHWLNDKNYAIAEELDQFRFLRECKQSGRVKKIGFSYHDGPELLEEILIAHPEVDYVQLQINYLDWNSPTLQAEKCYDIAVKYGKKVIVMEPVKGGNLAILPQQAEDLLHQLKPRRSPASWAIGFATSLPNVEVVLSGMNAMEQMEENMCVFAPLSENELETLEEAAKVIRSNTAISCTGCSYCTSHCPIRMPIPQYFAIYNDYARSPGDDWKMQHAYERLARQHISARECIACRQCEKNCPQKIHITDHLKTLSSVFDKNQEFQ